MSVFQFQRTASLNLKTAKNQIKTLTKTPFIRNSLLCIKKNTLISKKDLLSTF